MKVEQYNLELFEVWEINVRQIIIIANGINFKQPKPQTALARVQLQEACNPTSKYAKNS